MVNEVLKLLSVDEPSHKVRAANLNTLKVLCSLLPSENYLNEKAITAAKLVTTIEIITF